MLTVRWDNLWFDRECAVAIGNFDGVHIGHQALLKKVQELANKAGAIPVALTFHPHPLKVFRKGTREHFCLTPLEEKVRLLHVYGAKRVVVLEFNEALYTLTAKDFVKKVLLERLKAKAVVVGQNFRFGLGREGDVALMRTLAAEFGFEFYAHESVMWEGVPVSSTRIRRVLRQGDVKSASAMLGRPYKVIGRVVTGEGRGKLLGFPTANVEPENEVIPQNGVYATLVDIGGSLYKGVTNIGMKPTFNYTKLTVETHILDFDRDIYGERIGLFFIERLRDEMKFDSIDMLKRAIERDVKRGRKLLEWELILKA